MNRSFVLAAVLIGAAFGAGGTWLAGRIAPGDLSSADRGRVERVVREYVLANPELIPQAMQRLQAKDAAKQVSGHRGALETPYRGAFLGNPNGDVTLVEFFDYNCGYCRASLPVIRRLVAADPNLKVVLRELPILADSSTAAARASLQAAAQNRYWAFHQALFARGQVTDAGIAAAARSAGVDLSRPAPGGEEELAGNLRLAQAVGVQGTPAWVVGDAVLTGAQPFAQLQSAIAAARSR